MPERIAVGAPGAETEIARRVGAVGESLPSTPTDGLVLICVGTDRSIGDALGPLVGSILREQGPWPFAIFGCLDEPVHAGNLQQVWEQVKARWPAALVVAVDACLGRVEAIGTVCVTPGPLRPGAGVHKTLPAIGDMHVTGVVNVGGFMEYFVLQNTRLGPVMQMARTIAAGLGKGLSRLSGQMYPLPGPGPHAAQPDAVRS